MHFLISDNTFYVLVLCIVSRECVYADDEFQEPDERDSTHTAHVEVKAVFIKCSNEGFQDQTQDSEELRFRREELHKHGTLTDCGQKIAITMKLANDDKHTSEEYIPIEHVFEGPNKKRVLLLDPYVVRLRREPLLQAYKLLPLETVIGIFSKRTEKSKPSPTSGENKRFDRKQRDAQYHSRQSPRWAKGPFTMLELGHGPNGRHSFSVKVENSFKSLEQPNVTTKPDCGLVLFMNQTAFTQSTDDKDWKPSAYDNVKDSLYTKMRLKKHTKSGNHDMTQTCSIRNKSQHRSKRSELNVVVQRDVPDSTDPYDEDDRAQRDHRTRGGMEYTRDEQNQYTEREDDVTDRSFKDIDEVESKNIESDDVNQTSAKKYNENQNVKKHKSSDDLTHKKQKHVQAEHVKHKSESLKDNKLKYEHSGNKGHRVLTIDKNEPEKSDKASAMFPGVTAVKTNERTELLEDEIDEDEEGDGNMYEVYEIGDPDLWYTVNLQLFQKQITPDGSTLWNDLTKGETASVSSLYRFWKSPGLTVRYKPVNKIDVVDYTLPVNGLYLLRPKLVSTEGKSGGDIRKRNYIVVHSEDIIGKIGARKRDENSTEHGNATNKVIIRVSRAWLTDEKDQLNMINQDKDFFLTLPFKKTLRSQIDIEAKADDNQLVRIGSSGLISIIVSDATRRSRTTLSVEATNTGLAAASFRVQARDCGGGTPSEDGDTSTSQLFLIPPHHNKRFTIHVSPPPDVTQCSVALMNDRDESVAVRDVSIKSGDRCFCVWHCQCTCLSEDPKLLCRDMSETEILVAGLGGKDRPRPVRACCYTNCLFLNVLITVFLLLCILFLFGFIKAVLGVCFLSIGHCGLNRVIKMPRCIPHYYERSLRQRCVEYDCGGWPVHPDTKKRTVRVISYPMEFFLNLIFFILLPCVLLRDVWKKYKQNRVSKCVPGCDDTANYYTSQDMQTAASAASLEGSTTRLKKALQDWMTPNADKVSKDLWTRMMDPAVRDDKYVMHPILHSVLADKESHPDDHCSGNDTEQDDTEYVLMQMRKSRESLARSQRKLDESPLVTPTKK